MDSTGENASGWNGSSDDEARRNQISSRHTGRSGRWQAGERSGWYWSTRNAATSEPLCYNELNVDANFNFSATTEEGSELSTSIPGQDGHALTTNEEAESTAEVGAQGRNDIIGQEARDIDKEVLNKGEGGLGGGGSGQPEKNSTLHFDSKRTARAGEPDSESVVNVNIENGSQLASSTSLEGNENIGFNVHG
jgi:hypothetical protein